jgi:hypothetical protein
MGGFASAAHARHDHDLPGVVLIDAWNAGSTGDQMSKIPKHKLPTAAVKRFNDIGNSLHGATAASVVAETIAHRTEWNYQSWASHLTRQPLLVIGASRGRGEDSRNLAEAVTGAGGKVTAVTFESDHCFQDHRIADGPNDWDVAVATMYPNYAAIDQIDAKAATISTKHYGSREAMIAAAKNRSEIREVVASKLAREVIPK